MLLPLLILFFSIVVGPAAVGYGQDIQVNLPGAQEEEKDKVLDQYYRDKPKEGWYWYKEEPKKKKPEEKQEKKEIPQAPEIRIPSLKDYSYKQLWDMHPDEFQPLLTDFLKKAVQDPKEENVKEYMVMQDIARRKSLAYSNSYMAALQKNPEFTTSDAYSVSAPGGSILQGMRSREIKKTIEGARDDFGIIFFYSRTCPQCAVQKDILNYFTRQYGWEMRWVDIEKEARYAQGFNVQMVPHLLLVRRSDGDHLTLSQGVSSLSDIEENLFRGVRLLRGETSPEEWSTYDYEKGGGFDVNKYNRTQEGKDVP